MNDAPTTDDNWSPPLFHQSKSKPNQPIQRLDELQSPHLYNIANQREKDGHDPRDVAHIRGIANSKVDEWMASEPEAYAAWAERNPDSHSAHQARRSAAGGGQ